MQVPGFWELILIVAVALVIFGPRRLPEIGQALGRGIREFRSAVKDVSIDDDNKDESGLPRRGSDRA